jgi:hypothetical protein
MKKLLGLALTLAASSALSHPEGRPINSGSELRDWCKAESQASFIGKGQTPFNWSASYWDEGNVLMVKGSWRINESQVIVECRVARGAEARYATMTVRETQ